MGALGAPGDPPGWGKSAVFAPSTPRLSAEQIDCIFTMDYGCRGPPTPKNAAILAAAESSRHSSLSGWRASAWNPRAMATAYARWILNDASESIVNMQRSASYLRLIFRFCDFLILVLPLYYFLGGCWGSLGPATASERRVTIHCKYAGIGVLASYDFST